MRRSLFPLAFCLFLAGVCTNWAAEGRDLILVAGQSNAVGFDAYASELPPDASDKNVLFWWRCGDPPPDEHDSISGHQWTSLQTQPVGNPIPRENKSPSDPTPKIPRQYGNFAKPEGGFGPEMGLARELQRKEHKPLAIVKVAFSGTSMQTDWNSQDPGESGACYRSLVDETKAAIAVAREKGIELHLRALIWVQGESDANPKNAPDYEHALRTMLATLRHDLDAPQLIALLGLNTHFGNDKNSFVPKIVEAQQAIAAQDTKHCAYVDTSTAETLRPTQTHFTAKGMVEVGQRFATALLTLEAAK